MRQINFKNKVTTAQGSFGTETLNGVEISHAVNSNEVRLQGLVKQGDAWYHSSSTIGIPADPVMLDDLVSELIRLSNSLKTGHVK